MSTGRTLSARPRSTPSDDAGGGSAAKQGGRGSKQANLQDAFLNLLRKNKIPVTMFLVKGVKLQGIVTKMDVVDQLTHTVPA